MLTKSQAPEIKSRKLREMKYYRYSDIGNFKKKKRKTTMRKHTI